MIVRPYGFGLRTSGLRLLGVGATRGHGLNTFLGPALGVVYVVFKSWPGTRGAKFNIWSVDKGAGCAESSS